jgi:outer membrane protein assembly factor BamD (BamD/ComL family)
MFRTGDYYFKLRAYDSAVQYFDDTLELYPGAAVVPRVLLRLYQAYQALGYGDEAQSARERLLRDYPSSEEAARIRSVDGDA